jgi:hypothetical protein
MIRKALLLSVAIAASVLVPVTSNAVTTVNLCVAYDLGGPGDRSYNDAVLAGLTKAKKNLNFNYEGFITDGSALDREKRIRAMIAKGCSPILAIGSGYAKLLKNLAVEFPTQQFSILNDASIASLNITSLVFNDKQVGYCQGTNFIVMVLLSVFKSECLSFWAFVQIMYNKNWRQLFITNTPKLFKILGELTEKIKLKLFTSNFV